jgi:putative CocE/NonD family hydrolase
MSDFCRPRNWLARFSGLRFLALLGLAALGSVPPLRGAETPSFASRYTKSQHRIPMRDGVRLHTTVYRPRDPGATNRPILLQRTPYGQKPYTIDALQNPGVPESYLGAGFILAVQDVRGRFASEGSFEDVRPIRPRPLGPREADESTDAWDTIEWLVRHVPGHNGNVGLQGISYLGFFAAAGMIDSHPALKAVSPQAPVADLYEGDDSLHHGCVWLAHNFGFVHFFSQDLADPTREEPRPFDFKTPDGYRFFLEQGPIANLDARFFHGKAALWNDIIHHSTNAAWAAARNVTPHLRNVRAAVLTVGGWFDAEDLSGTLKTYRATEAQNPGIPNALVMGPWSHGGWHGGGGDKLGHLDFHAPTAEYFRDEIEMPFFRRFLLGDTNATYAEATVFETGTGRWRREDAWPPARAVPRTLHFHPDGRLDFEPPADAGPGFDEYVSDPAHPVPFTEQVTTGMPGDYMVADQRFAARRPDVLVYQTDPLPEDVTLAGPIQAVLRVSTTGTDSDWVVKLIDVYTGDHPDPNPNPARVRMGGVPATRPRGTLPREVPQRSHSRPTRALRSGRTRHGPVHPPRRLSHLPHRPPDHDPDPEFLVPARRPESPDVLRHLPGAPRRLPQGHPAAPPPARRIPRRDPRGSAALSAVGARRQIRRPPPLQPRTRIRSRRNRPPLPRPRRIRPPGGRRLLGTHERKQSGPPTAPVRLHPPLPRRPHRTPARPDPPGPRRGTPRLRPRHTPVAGERRRKEAITAARGRNGRAATAPEGIDLRLFVASWFNAHPGHPRPWSGGYSPGLPDARDPAIALHPSGTAPLQKPI